MRRALPDEQRRTGAGMPQQSRSARLAASALSLVVTVLALFVPSAAAYGAPAGAPPTRHAVAAHAGRPTGPHDTPALHIAVTHRPDAHIPGPQPPGPGPTALDSAPHRARGWADARPATDLAPPQRPRATAAPRGPPHR
ncbi:hypothetical protein ACFVYR_32505 [Streptomyces sp. NPDC058284]|uniref:hypothetical protein n=1 Tax=unclassified Streptomyces TaxID=2593676 RepID=UPI0036635616